MDDWIADAKHRHVPLLGESRLYTRHGSVSLVWIPVVKSDLVRHIEIARCSAEAAAEEGSILVQQ
jgi:hypothetical protein